MKIVKPGFDDPQWTMTIVCIARENPKRGCGATLEVSKEDLFLKEVRSTKSEGVYITCPCGQEISLGNIEQFNFKTPPKHKALFSL